MDSGETRRDARHFEQRIEIETPEQVVFGYTVAGIGSRSAAALIDLVLIVLLSVALWVGASFLLSAMSGQGLGLARLGGSWLFAILILVQFTIMWGYFVLFEAFWDGQTPGKRRVGIRVVQDGGYSVTFAASAVRNLLRVVDMLPPPTYALGLVTAAISPSGKRFGDMLAGTIIVQERILDAPSHAAKPRPDDALPAALTASLTEREYELLDRFLARRASLDAERRRAITEQLANRFAAQLPPAATPLARLIELHANEQHARRRGIAARGNVGAAREEHAIVARSLPRWSDFAARLAEVQRRGLRGMPESEVSDFVARYREVTTDFARLKTASGGREPESLFYVSRLVAAGHNLLYRQRPLALGEVWRFFAVTVPGEVRRSAVPILIAAVCLFGPMAITWGAIVANPGLAEHLLPAAMIDRADEGARRAAEEGLAAAADRGAYVSISDLERPVLASRLITNNVQVTYLAFALGILAGLGTITLLAFNGISIGAGFGLFASKGILLIIGAFVIPHGPFELTAICIAGGAGLLVGSALLMPGDRTRREALVVRGRRAIRLVACSTLFLVFAGAIEGFISPRDDIPMWLRLAVAAGSVLVIVLYLTRGIGAADATIEDNAYSEARALTSR